MKIKSRLTRGLSVLGPLGIVGIGLLLCAAAFFFSSVVPTRADVAAMQRHVVSHDGHKPSTRASPQDPLSDFHDFFPPRETTARWLGAVYSVAERERLELPKGEYRLTALPSDTLVTYEAVFASRGSYAQLRNFMAALLQEVPIVALDDIRLERQRTVDSVVDARIKLTFFLRTR